MNHQHQHILSCFTIVEIGRWHHLKAFFFAFSRDCFHFTKIYCNTTWFYYIISNSLNYQLQDKFKYLFTWVPNSKLNQSIAVGEPVFYFINTTVQVAPSGPAIWTSQVDVVVVDSCGGPLCIDISANQTVLHIHFKSLFFWPSNIHTVPFIWFDARARCLKMYILHLKDLTSRSFMLFSLFTHVLAQNFHLWR